MIKTKKGTIISLLKMEAMFTGACKLSSKWTVKEQFQEFEEHYICLIPVGWCLFNKSYGVYFGCSSREVQISGSQFTKFFVQVVVTYYTSDLILHSRNSPDLL